MGNTRAGAASRPSGRTPPKMPDAEKAALAAEAAEWLLPGLLAGPKDPHGFRQGLTREMLQRDLATMTPGLLAALAAAPRTFTADGLMKWIRQSAGSWESATMFHSNNRDISRWKGHAKRSLHTFLGFGHVIGALAEEGAPVNGSIDFGLPAAKAEDAWLAESMRLNLTRGRGICDEDPDTREYASAYVLCHALTEHTVSKEITEEMIAFARSHLHDPGPLIRAAKARRTLDPAAIEPVVTAPVPALSDGAL